MPPVKNKTIKILLVESDLSQRDLSRKTGIPENYLSLIINGRYFPDRKQRERIAAALGRTESELFAE